MMQCREIVIGDEVVPFYYGHDCLDNICRRLAALDADRFLIVTDHYVERLNYAAALFTALERLAPTLLLSSAPGEGGKDLKTALSCMERAIEWGATRRSVVVTLGGGVPGNLGGLIAALLFRGIRLAHIPTTLIGMLDSVVSLKQAVNSRFGKNLIGTFYKPTLILADTRFLKTLSTREVRAGICEVIKNVLAIHPQMIEPLRERLSPDCEYDTETFRFMLESSLAAKAEVMFNDKCEKGRGLILEYGHTIGHALELADHYEKGEGSISHGEAVGIGMIGAAQIAFQIGILDELSLALHHDLLARAGARRSLPDEIPPELVMRFLRFDNKRGYCQSVPDHIHMILLRRPGVPFGRAEMPLTPVPLPLIESSLNALCGGSALTGRSAFQEV